MVRVLLSSFGSTAMIPFTDAVGFAFSASCIARLTGLGRGLRACLSWHNYSGFKAYMGECPLGYSLDRIHNDRGYEPGNCRWIPMAAQAGNKRTNHRLTYQGQTMTIAAWARKIGLNERSLRSRIVDCGWSVERALTAPLMSAADCARLAVATRVSNRSG
jgi:hypothetical protein